MQLGFLTVPFPEQNLGQVADWAGKNGFSTLEVACWPAAGGDVRRYAGTSHIDVDGLDASKAGELVSQLGSCGVTISALGYYPNPLHPEQAIRDAAFSHLGKIIDAASLLGVKVVNTFVGGDKRLTVDQNWERAVELFPALVNHARDKGVILAFENCPMIFSHDEWPGGHNIAYSPKVWRRIFETWGDAVGMNYDPSHLVWQMIDQSRFIREFGSRIVHVHAKDLMVDHDGLYENGVLSAGIGWQVPRMPGLGDIQWPRFFSDLYRCGYDGPIVIEHEDRTFEGSEERIKRGFLLARDVLQPHIK